MEVSEEDGIEAEECRDDIDQPKMVANGGKGDSNFDAMALQESMEILCNGSCSSKLTTTMLLMNLCTIHEMRNHYAN